MNTGRSRARLPLFSLLFALPFLLALLAWGGDPGEPAPHGVLVLKTGSVIEGRILKTGDNYEVELPRSRMFVPGELVKIRAESLVDAYDLMRKELPPEGGLKDRLALAKWCVTNRLLSQARSQLKTILELDDTHEGARQLLKRIDEVLDPATPAEAPSAEEKLQQIREGAAPQVPALAGLPKELGQEYVRKIQPILMNGCALASCHGPQGLSEFRLQRVRSDLRSARGPSEANLIEVLKHVNDQKPRSSPLLAVPQENNHGLKNRPLFGGHSGDEQLAALQAWVVRVSKAKKAAARTPESPAKDDPEVVPASASEPTSDVPKPQDPFNPDTFNRELPTP